MRFEVPTEIRIYIVVVWVVPCSLVVTNVSEELLPPSSLSIEDGGSMFLRNENNRLPDYKVS
jgi:hypothetical protein